MYVERAPALFRKVPVISTISRILFGRMYDVQRLHRLITEEMASEGAGDWTLNDVPLDILITAKGLLDSHQWYFVKDRPDLQGLTGDRAWPIASPRRPRRPSSRHGWWTACATRTDGGRRHGRGAATRSTRPASRPSTTRRATSRPTRWSCRWGRGTSSNGLPHLDLQLAGLDPGRAAALTRRAADRAGGPPLPRVHVLSAGREAGARLLARQRRGDGRPA